jgi:hypothetical protein
MLGKAPVSRSAPDAIVRAAARHSQTSRRQDHACSAEERVSGFDGVGHRAGMPFQQANKVLICVTCNSFQATESLFSAIGEQSAVTT